MELLFAIAGEIIDDDLERTSCEVNLREMEIEIEGGSRVLWGDVPLRVEHAGLYGVRSCADFD